MDVYEKFSRRGFKGREGGKEGGMSGFIGMGWDGG